MALNCFTVLFGMGRGGTRRLLPPDGNWLYPNGVDSVNWKKVFSDCGLLVALISRL